MVVGYPPPSGGDSSIARERSGESFERCRFESCQLESLRQHRLLSIESFGRAVEFGLSVKRETASGFKPRPSRPMAGFPTHLLSVFHLVGPNADGFRSSTGRASCVDQEAAGSTPAEAKPRLCSLAQRFSISTGRRIGLSPVTRVVAGSSPASGSKCRSSSVVEHVNPSSILIRRLFSGP